ncbi:MAG: efflux RND transporter permease subunit [Bacteroidaceae bacterium]|nr:efflux RND transporter permease subunit [Bacteroidaceae bacterium]
MVKFLINRPIAVLMAFTACCIIGLVTYFTLPVSLLPDIAIPEITVQVTAQNTSARELENTVMRQIRQQLMQVSKLKTLECRTRDGSGIIRLGFEYGTNTDLAFIEVNEKIDASMNFLPKDIDRPKVIKASATDIPVFYLNLTTDAGFLELSEVAEGIIKRRIEQLPEVAMVDITGTVQQQLQIIPDEAKMASMGLTVSDLENALTMNNVTPGSMTVRDGHYEYNIRFNTLLRTADDVKNILLNKGNRFLRMGDFCEVEQASVKAVGMSEADGKQAVTLAVIKQADENMDNMKEVVNEVIDTFRVTYPHINFQVSRNQTELLDYTISNLQQNLLLGFVFIFIVAVFFLGDVRSPLIIGVSMVVSIITCFVFFYLFNMSLNIISISGLILALGMMIDSSIIVTENISQYREKGHDLSEACVAGTTEVITPMLSSSLTTIAVFVPLIFMSGIAGALFYDQAFAVSVGLLVSYFTGIMLLPVLYYLVYRILNGRRSTIDGQQSTVTFRSSEGRAMLASAMPSRDEIGAKLNGQRLMVKRWYDAGISWVFSHKLLCSVATLLTLPLCVLMFNVIHIERMPEIDQRELMVRVDWNEHIHLDENRSRVDALFAQTKASSIEQTAAIGQQDYLLDRGEALSVTEAELYFKTEETKDIAPLQKQIASWIQRNYPSAVVTFYPPETLFEKLFDTGEAPFTAEFYARNKAMAPRPDEVRGLHERMTSLSGLTPEGLAFENQLNIHISQELLQLYHVSYDEVIRVLRTAFKENSVAVLHANQQNMPVSIVSHEQTVSEVLANTLVKTDDINYIPLNSLVKLEPSEDLKTITAGRNGEYIPFRFFDVADERPLENVSHQVADEAGHWDVSFSGSIYDNREMMGEMVVILLISIMLMYFILASQFESFVQPLIVLLEIPIDVAAALVLLWVCGHTLNLMSAIGIIVTCGIIINDSILKIDVINELRKKGMPLLEAIHEAGRRRLRSIIMTSLTTIFAMLPLLFSFDMGSELQKPLAIAMIGAMVVGTLVSLFIIPLAYWRIYKD